MIQSVARQPELRGELQGIQWLGFALTEAVVFYGLLGWHPRLRPRLVDARRKPDVAANPLIQVTPGLMIWTIVCFLITFFVLKRYAFGPIQKMIDERRERIRESLDGGRQRARGGAQAARGAPRADRPGARRRPRRSSRRRGASRTRSASASARRPRPTGSAGSRRRAARSRRRRRGRSSRSAQRGRRARRSSPPTKVTGKVARRAPTSAA